jgi:hypothetical protein
MTSKLLGVMTGVALLASIGVANAGQRAPLTDAQLDKVVAGVASASASVGNAASVAGSTFILLNDNANGMRNATILGTFVIQDGAPHTASLSAAVAP